MNGDQACGTRESRESWTLANRELRNYLMRSLFMYILQSDNCFALLCSICASNCLILLCASCLRLASSCLDLLVLHITPSCVTLILGDHTTHSSHILR